VFSLLPPDNATGNFTKTVQRVPVEIVFDQNSVRGFQNLRLLHQRNLWTGSVVTFGMGFALYRSVYPSALSPIGSGLRCALIGWRISCEHDEYAFRSAGPEDVRRVTALAHAAYRRKALLAVAEGEARRAGFDSIYLFTHEKMAKNLALYAKIESSNTLDTLKETFRLSS
jgi:hypothetical protein